MIKLYVAILNHGWVRSEFVTDVLPKLWHTEGVETTLENLGKTWMHPISSNRNAITKRFLQSGADFLLMFDDDVVPLGNPAAFCALDKDVIGFPAKVRQTSQTGSWILSWVAYSRIKGTDDYLPVRFENFDDQTALVKVDAVGTGCILIARRVLAGLKAPFHTEFDEDGILTVGTDFAFCRKAQAAGFEILTAPQCVCEHYKELGMLNFSAIADSEQIDPAANAYTIPWGGMAINPDDWNFIRKIICARGPAKILEFGCGLSTLLMSEYAEVIAYETDPSYADVIRAKANGNGNLAVRLWDGIVPDRDMPSADLIFIDGPPNPSLGGPGREAAFRAAAQLSDHIIVHDANRDAEANWQQLYLQPHFALKRRSGYHQTACHYWVRRS